MSKNIIFTLCCLLALAASHSASAAEQQATPALSMPAEQVKPAATETPASSDKFSGTGKEAIKQPASTTQPANDSHTDYRYCLELKTDLEIANCRYKK